MKTRTRMLSYAMAFVMLLTCILSVDWLSTTAFAGGGDGDTPSTTVKLTEPGLYYGPQDTYNSTKNLIYAVYFVPSDCNFGDGEAVSRSDMLTTFDNILANEDEILKYRQSAVFFDPSLSSGKTGKFNCLVGEKSTTRDIVYNVVTTFAPEGDWSAIFPKDSDDFVDESTKSYSMHFNARWNSYQASHTVAQEKTGLYDPYIECLEKMGFSNVADAMRAAWTANEPLTLIVEPYWQLTHRDTKEALFVSALESNMLCSHSSYLKYCYTYDEDGLTWGTYYTLSHDGSMYGKWAPSPMYKATREDTTQTSFDNCNKSGKVTFGWGYFTICNGERGGTVTFDITKKPNTTASGGASAAEFNSSVSASFEIQGATEEDIARGTLAMTKPFTWSDRSLAGLYNDYKDAGGTLTAGKVGAVMSWARDENNKSSVVKASINTDDLKTSVTLSMTDATKVWYFYIQETGVGYTCTDYNIVSAPTYGGILLRYEPKIVNGELKGATWTSLDLKAGSGSTDNTMCTFSVTSSSEHNLAIVAENPFEISKDPSVDFVAPSVTVLDVDDYYVTGYKSDYGLTNNRQLIYTRSTLVNPDNAAFFPAWAIDPNIKALSNSKAEVLQASEANNVTTLNIPTDNATYTAQGITSKNGTVQLELQPDALKSFTVNKDYIRDYSNIKDNPSSISSTFTSVVTSAETEQGTLTISFNGGETYKLGTNTTDWDDYVKYAEAYSKYEAAIATSAGEVRAALQYWSQEALNLIAEAKSIYNSLPTTRSARSEDAVTDAWNEISALSDKLKDITGWTLQFKSYYYDPCTTCGADGWKNCSSCGGHGGYWRSDGSWRDCWRCGGTGEVECSRCDRTGYLQKTMTKNGASSYGVTVKGSSGISSSVAPSAISALFADNNKSISTSSLLGKLCDINVDQLKEIAKLEEGRPNAEIHLYSEFGTQYDDTVYKAADVPEWYIAMRWKDQKAFLKDGSLLSTLLDFEAYAHNLGSSIGGTTKEVDKEPLVLLAKLQDSYQQGSRAYFQFRNSETSSSYATVYSPMYAWYFKDTSIANTATKVVSAMGTSSFTPTSGTATKNGKFVLNSSKTSAKAANLVYIANLDAFGYAQTAIAAWTSVWQIIDGNPTNDYLPSTDWVLPSDVQSAVTAAATLPNAKRSNTATLGSNARGTDTYVIGNPSASTQSTAKLVLTYSKNALTANATSLIDYYISKYTVNKGGTSVNTSKSDSVTNWYSANVPYTLTAEFKHFNVGEQPSVPEHTPESVVVENNDPETPTDTSTNIGGWGRYTRDPDREVFSIYPLVKRGYYSQVADTPSTTYTIGQKPRTLESHVYYYVGINGTANPTVVANSLGSGTAAQDLSRAADGAPVALSGTGITVSYDPSVSLLFQSFNLCNIDAESAYQSEWDNDVASESAHLEWLHSMGATEYTATVDGTTVTTLGIPYIAGVDCYINNTASAWQLTQDGAQIALKDDSSDATQDVLIRLRVEKGVLTEVELTGTIIAAADGTGAIAAGKFSGTTTEQTLARTPAYLSAAIRNLIYTDDGTDILEETFVNGAGTRMTQDANGNIVASVAAENAKWYNEYCYCIGIKFSSTSFQLQPLMFTDKIPVELGPKTPADKSQYYTDGYGFMAQSLMLKIGTTPDPTQSSASPEETGVDTLMDEVWMITRDELKYDLVISNVPVTGANN